MTDQKKPVENAESEKVYVLKNRAQMLEMDGVVLARNSGQDGIKGNEPENILYDPEVMDFFQEGYAIVAPQMTEEEMDHLKSKEDEGMRMVIQTMFGPINLYSRWYTLAG